MIARAIASLGVLAIALTAAIMSCELAVRVLDGQPLLALRLPEQSVAVKQPPRLTPLVTGRPLPADVDPTWIDVQPPPLKNRAPIAPEILERLRAVRCANVKPFEALRIWNRRFVAQKPCGPGGSFRCMPQPLLVFDPPNPASICHSATRLRRHCRVGW